MSWWGRELHWPEDPDGDLCWLSREAVPDRDEALALVASELGEAPDRLDLTPVLMREESEVEADINGHEMPYWVECTTRACAPEPFWRVSLHPEEKGSDG